MEELTHTIDSKLGKYGFYYDESSGSYKFTFNYWTDPRFGQYVMYYDIIASGAMRYNFRFRVDPKYGIYTFIYSPLENLYIEQEEVLVKVDNQNTTALTDMGVSVVREESSKVKSTIDSFSTFIGSLRDNMSVAEQDNVIQVDNTMNSKEISIDEFISLLFYDSIVHNKMAIVDDEFTVKEGSINKLSIRENIEKVSINQDKTIGTESNEEKVIFEDRLAKDVIAPSFSISTIDILNKIQSDEKLIGSIERAIEIEQEKRLNNPEYATEIEQQERFDRQDYAAEIEEEHRLHRQDLSTHIHSDSLLRRQDLNTNIQSDFLAGFNERKMNINRDELEVIKDSSSFKVNKDSQDILLDKIAGGHNKSISIESIRDEKVVKSASGNNLNIKNFNNFVSINKYHNNIKIDENEEKVGKSLGDIAILDNLNQLKKAPTGNTTADKQLGLSKISESASIDDGSIESDLAAKSASKEVEERLDLHKRFWFLESLGEMDYKILPNVDYKYPPNIEIFKSGLPEKKYVYKYVDRFEDLGNYRVRLYDEDLSIAAQHDVMFIRDYAAEINGVDLTIKVNEVQEEKYNYEVEFTVETDTEMEYMVINQPKGFIGNEFVFVGTEKFLADNHPIPFGEDLGLKEIPVSIPIMVDFVNILLLLWSKRMMAFSGMTGTQAIKGVNELAYEWLTLDTSLEQESIEDYHRCYRWLRWESEKVYNKAKQDPNLKGNRWIEEVIFEMIDYLEMHHFNKMPEWDEVLRMDEQRDIFNSPDYDIPIVLDKFKGIRKRAMEKNKRYN